MTRKFRPAATLMATTALALALGGCKIDNRPLLARGGPPPGESAAAPPIGPLGPGYASTAAAPVPQAEAYAYPQRAYAMSQAVYQRPPSDAFSYGEEQPWAWDAGDQGVMFAEPVDDGYRYYYYAPGEARPYFVQDPDYGYAYGADGALVGLFAATGALIAADHYRDYAPRAERYWTRAYDLDRAYRRSPHRPVQTAVWRARAPALATGHDRWFRAASAQPAWRAAAAQRHDGRLPGAFENPGRDRHGAGEIARTGPHFQPQHAAGSPGREANQARGPQPGPHPQHGPPASSRQAQGGQAQGGQARHGPAFSRAEAPRGRAGPRPSPVFHAPPQHQPQPQAQHRPPGGHGQDRHQAQGRGGPAFARTAAAHGPGAGGHGPTQFHARPQAQAPHGPPGGGGPHHGGQPGGGAQGARGGHGGAGHGGGDHGAGDHGGKGGGKDGHGH